MVRYHCLVGCPKKAAKTKKELCMFVYFCSPGFDAFKVHQQKAQAISGSSTVSSNFNKFRTHLAFAIPVFHLNGDQTLIVIGTSKMKYCQFRCWLCHVWG